MLRFPKLHEKIVDVVTNLLRRRLQPTNSMVSVGWWTEEKKTSTVLTVLLNDWIPQHERFKMSFQSRFKVTFGSNLIIKNIYFVKTS